jgi:hypothetical protein
MCFFSEKFDDNLIIETEKKNQVKSSLSQKILGAELRENIFLENQNRCQIQEMKYFKNFNL